MPRTAPGTHAARYCAHSPAPLGSGWRSTLLWPALLAAVCCATARAAGQPGELYLIDAHSQADSARTLQRVIPLLDAAGVKRTILSARRELGSTDIADYAQAHRERIIPAIRTKSGAYARNKRRYYQTLDSEAASGRFAALAELLMYHAAKGNKADEVIVHPDDPRIDAALDQARKHGWPLVVHIEFAALGTSERAGFMSEMEALLQRFPAHPFALIHMGQLDAAEVERLIAAHENLYFMTSHADPVSVAESRQPWVNMFAGEALAPEWQALLLAHPDRFVLAFDNVWPEQWDGAFARKAALWRSALGRLPLAVAHAVAHANAERLWKIPTE